MVRKAILLPLAKSTLFIVNIQIFNTVIQRFIPTAEVFVIPI